MSGKRLAFRAPLPVELAEYAHTLGKAAGTNPQQIDAALKEYL